MVHSQTDKTHSMQIIMVSIGIEMYLQHSLFLHSYATKGVTEYVTTIPSFQNILSMLQI